MFDLSAASVTVERPDLKAAGRPFCRPERRACVSHTDTSSQFGFRLQTCELEIQTCRPISSRVCRLYPDLASRLFCPHSKNRRACLHINNEPCVCNTAFTWQRKSSFTSQRLQFEEKSSKENG